MSGRQLRLTDGRRIGISAIGDAAASRWVLFCHPAPGSGGFDPDPAATHRCSLYVVSPDRPGYGASDPWAVPPQPSPQRWVLDVQEYLALCRGDAESIGRDAYRDLAVLGWREGCVFAAVLAAALGEEAASVAFVEPVTLRAAGRSLRRRDVWDAGRLGPSSGVAEREFADGGLRSRVERMLRAARQQGEAGIDADRAAMGQQVLGESLKAIPAPALVVARNTEATVRVAHGYARRLERARVAVTDAPVPIAAHWRRILAHLAVGSR